MIVLLVLSIGSAGAAEPAPTEIKLSPYLGALRTVNVKVATRELPFIFDTGGGLSFVTPKVASELGCTPFGRFVGFRMSGERVNSLRCGKLPLRVEGLDRNVEIAVFDIMSLLPEGCPELGGIISLHTFRGQQLSIDLASERMTVETPESFAHKISGMKRLSSRIGSESGGEGLDLFVEVAAKKGSLWFLLDSGNLDKVLIAPHALKQLGVPDPGPEGTQLALELVGYGPITVDAAPREMIYDGVLNAATMAKFLLALNLETGAVWAAPHIQPPEAEAGPNSTAGSKGRKKPESPPAS